jgi:arylsulfatase
MKKMDEWGLADSTLLIFMTDNGTAAGRDIYNYGMRGGKGSVNEGGSRVPLFMRLPGTTMPGTEVNRLTRHVDLFPTLAEFAGAEIPAGLDLDGRSLLPLIRDPNADWPDRYTFFHKGRWGKKGAPARFAKGHCDPDQAKYETFAVRSEKWRLVGKDQLYDIENDPGEEDNVIAENPEVAERMLAAYDRWWDEVRPLMINEDAPLDVEKPFIVQFNKQKEETGIPDWISPEI